MIKKKLVFTIQLQYIQYMERLLLNVNIFLAAVAIGINSVPLYYYFFPLRVLQECCGCGYVDAVP